jgi:putative peptidoglycan lipid II flippase
MSVDAGSNRSAPTHGRLLTATSVVGSFTLLSRITGLVRDIAFSSWLGAGVVMDAFAVAFKIPNLLRRFFAEGAFSQAFVPVIAEYRTHRSADETRELISRTSGTLGLALFVVTLIGVVAAPLLILAFAPGFAGDDGRLTTAAAMLRLTFPYLLFVSLTALAGSILNANGRFAAAAFTPVLLNVTMIVFAGWVDPLLGRPGLGLALGVLVAGIVQLAFQLPFLARIGLLVRPRWGAAHEGVRRIFRLMFPAIFGSSVAQISILLDTLIASFLVAGSISWLYYSDRVMEFPLGVFGIALATVILPRLSEQHAAASAGTFSATLDWALRLVLVIGVPAALSLALLAEPILATLFYRGEFTGADVAMSAASLRAYAPGLVGFILVKVLAPGYFARQDTRTPVRVAVQSLLLGIVLNVMFVVFLVDTAVAPAHSGIAAATSCSGLFNATLLLVGLRKSGVYRPGKGWSALFLHVAGASAVMCAMLWWLLGAAGDWLVMGSLERAGWLVLAVAGGALVYFGGCYLLGMRVRDLRMRVSE